MQINTSDLKPVQTTAVKTQLNLDSREANPAKAPFDANDPSTYNKQIPIDVYDSLGNAHTMNSYYVETDAGTWDVYVANDGMEINNLKVAAAAQGTSAPFAAVNAARDAWKAAAQAVPPDAVAAAAALETYADEAAQDGAGRRRRPRHRQRAAPPSWPPSPMPATCPAASRATPRKTSTATSPTPSICSPPRSAPWSSMPRAPCRPTTRAA